MRKPQAAPAKPVRKNSIVVKMSPNVHEYVTEHGRWDETIDLTLRRLLGNPFQKWLEGKPNGGRP
jgi:hypothetical protein